MTTNAVSNALTIYPLDAKNNVKPVRSIEGPTTKLNYPVAVALYGAGQVGGIGDEYVVVNRDNNSIVTYSADDRDNASPLRTIWGLFTGLDKPSGLAVNLDLDINGNRGDPSKDEILVANSGNDSVTSYTRVASGDTFPLRTLQGPLTGLDHPCGVTIDKQHHEIFVTNTNANNVSVYDLYDLDGSKPVVDGDGYIVTNPTINISPLLTISGFTEPCGITVDSANADIYVANGGSSDNIFALDLAAVPTPEALYLNPATAPLQVTDILKRSITGDSGTNTKLQNPTAVGFGGGDVWVTHSGDLVTMTRLPSIIPAITNENAAANSTLNGDYNVVVYGIDFNKGVNGLGSKIPVIHAERGVANFNAQAVPWPTFTFQRDAGVKQFKRQVQETGCPQPDLNVKDGFYGIAANNSFYAFTEDNRGMYSGSFLANGEEFAAVSNYGSEQYLIYGIKSTGVAIPYLGADATALGGPAYYAYANYTNEFVAIGRFQDPPANDNFRYSLGVGYLYADPSQFISQLKNDSIVAITNPMGDFQSPVTSPVQTQVKFQLDTRTYPTTLHAGGLFENPEYGIAGAISNDSKSFIFMNDISTVDANDCQKIAGIGVGLRQRAANTFKTNDIMGTYYLVGIGDDRLSSSERDKYFSLSGTISFDGAGSATIVQSRNSEGEISASKDIYDYQVISASLPKNSLTGVKIDPIKTDILYLYTPDSAVTPYATALIGVDGKILYFYKTGTTRLSGLALLQNK